MAPGDGGSSSKREIQPLPGAKIPQKRPRLLLDDEDSGNSSSHSSQVEGVSLSETAKSDTRHGFTVNQEFARRFEHNKKREELHRLEEKYGKNESSTRRDTSGGIGDEESDSSSESEDEDDDAVLASEALDAQIEATLNAIRAKDPRVYDEKSTFYTDLDEEGLGSTADNKSKQKPMYLNDYHRQNLLQGVDIEREDEQPATYAQQQDDLRSTIVQEMHAAADGSLFNESRVRSGGLHEDSDDGFLVQKSARPDQTSRKSASKRIKLDVESADKDPETYLSSFMAARAWLPSGTGPQFQPFESDDDEEDRRAEAFEEAYNMRFEDPEGANEKLMSHARDAAARYSVRKETINSRKKTREAERAKKEAEKKEREEEKARLRKLQVAEAEEKVRKIKQAAGLRGEVLKEQDWSTLLNEGWDDARWEEEMKKRFGDEYYADHESDDGLETSGRSRRKLKKPTWDDDIDINDLVPDFEAGEATEKPHFALSDDNASDPATSGAEDSLEGRHGVLYGTSKAKKNRKATVKRERDEDKKKARKERRLIEKMVDEKLNAEDTIAGIGGRKTGHFRYRETSPITFGLTARDILMASDSQLNQYAGLKKMAAFRDNEKKRKDKKRLGKKARLREWRKETFGSEQGPQETLADVMSNPNVVQEASLKASAAQSTQVREGKKRRKRPKQEKMANVKS